MNCKQNNNQLTTQIHNITKDYIYNVSCKILFSQINTLNACGNTNFEINSFY